VLCRENNDKRKQNKTKDWEVCHINYYMTDLKSLIAHSSVSRIGKDKVVPVLN
jgi:hypothetical protein